MAGTFPARVVYAHYNDNGNAHEVRETKGSYTRVEVYTADGTAKMDEAILSPNDPILELLRADLAEAKKKSRP